MSNKKYKTGIVPGSFDPITKGHLDIIERAAKLCDKVFVAVMINDQKEYMFTLSEREEIARAACAGLKNVSVISSSGMLYELCRTLGVKVIIKGVRNEIDREYELKMAEYNAAHNPDATTLLLDANEELTNVSSTAVREMIKENGELGRYLPDGVILKIKEIGRTL